MMVVRILNLLMEQGMIVKEYYGKIYLTDRGIWVAKRVQQELSLIHILSTGDHIFQRVGGQRVDAGQILNDNVIVALQLAFLFFHGHAGPVAHVLVGGKNWQR